MLAGKAKGAFTLVRFRARFCTKLARLEMKKNYFAKRASLMRNRMQKIANVNAPLEFTRLESYKRVSQGSSSVALKY